MTKYTNKIALLEKDRKQEQKKMSQDIENFKKKFEGIDTDFKETKTTQDRQENWIQKNVEELEKVNHRIIEVRWLHRLTWINDLF